MMLQLTSFVVGLLCAMHSLGQFNTAHAHQGKEGLPMTGKHVELFDQKQPNIGGIPVVGLGGRKMVTHKVLKKLEPARPAGLNGETSTTTSSKKSGKDSKASSNSNGKSQKKLNQQQGHIKILEPTTLETAANSFAVPKGVEPKHSQDSKTKHPITKAQKTISYDNTDDHNLTDETRRLLKATREIANLMHKDYHATGRRKPPINNDEPQH